ncbi:MAG: hypothetical protein ACOC1G_07470 [Phycisphaeraceae bacterium]
MNFSTDRDLLALEPSVFLDLPLVGQRRSFGEDGELHGTSFTTLSGTFPAESVGEGGVILINHEPYEILSRIDAATLTVSLPRIRTSDPAIWAGQASAAHFVVRTFAHQAAVVHDTLMHLFGLHLDDPEQTLTEDALLSVTLAARLETLGTLERIYSAGAALTGDNEMLLLKADHYRRRFAAARERAVVLIDTDGDGFADVRRRLGEAHLLRA